MDDFNKDKVISKEDAVDLAAFLDALSKTSELKPFIGGLGVGDPACDLTVAWNLLPADTRNLFRAAALVDDASWERGRGFALSKALIQLPYYHQTNPVLAASARHVIGEVLADHRGPLDAH